MDNDSSNTPTTKTIDLFTYLREGIEAKLPPRALARMHAEEAGEVFDEAAWDAAEAEAQAERSRACRRQLIELCKEVLREHSEHPAFLAHEVEQNDISKRTHDSNPIEYEYMIAQLMSDIENGEVPTASALPALLEHKTSTNQLFWRERPVELFTSALHCQRWNDEFADKEAFTARCDNGHRKDAIFHWEFCAPDVVSAIESGEWPEGAGCIISTE